MLEGDVGSINKTFAFHKPSDVTKEKATTLRRTFSAMEDLIKETCPDSRERAIALTNLEQAGMWAIKSAVSNDPESTVETQ